MSRYQKGKTNLDFTGARDSERQWYQLGHMQVCTSLHTDNHASNSVLKFFTGRMPFLPPNQQCQSTEGNVKALKARIHSAVILSNQQTASDSQVSISQGIWSYLPYSTIVKQTKHTIKNNFYAQKQFYKPISGST